MAKVPTILHCPLRSYQLIGLNWLALLYEQRMGGILADESNLFIYLFIFLILIL